ncbi:hypothetical protein F53441_9850 [Fusarium austroafricanum]|uniref:Uncharacterized protein n=1 Tax=Fusarium austroafricanum TaxID=2364996 RepID=A0A8H4KA58_9HYPO|nr:hypothetical protein F53441_9850 [Fusarium austroafricanum]
MDSPNNTSQSQDPQVPVPKENSPPPENNPPPAYTPRRIPNLASMMARLIQEQPSPFSSRPGTIPQPRPQPQLQPQPQFQQTGCTALLSDAVSDDTDETSEGSSPISLKIDSSITVSCNNNIVCLSATPAEQANTITRAVVQALHDGSSGRCGIPMIDESGCPRPLKIEVDAAMKVEGSGNVIGSHNIIGEFAQRRAGSSRGRSSEHDDDNEDFVPPKRRRSCQ